MKINKQPNEVVITISPDDYFLVKCKDDMLGDYSLNYRIDRSEKGKCEDVGVEFMYLSESEAQIFKESGFSEFVI